MLVQGNVGYRWKASEALVVTPNVFLTYADDDYTDTYFGVNAKNEGTSGLDRYKAESGLKDVGTRIVAHYTPWEQWGIMGIVSYSALLEDAKDSPIVDEGDDTQIFFGLMATYRWGN
jgi:outer membrane protein